MSSSEAPRFTPRVLVEILSVSLQVSREVEPAWAPHLGCIGRGYLSPTPAGNANRQAGVRKGMVPPTGNPRTRSYFFFSSLSSYSASMTSPSAAASPGASSGVEGGVSALGRGGLLVEDIGQLVGGLGSIPRQPSRCAPFPPSSMAFRQFSRADSMAGHVRFRDLVTILLQKLFRCCRQDCPALFPGFDLLLVLCDPLRSGLPLPESYSRSRPWTSPLEAVIVMFLLLVRTQILGGGHSRCRWRRCQR